VLQRWLCRTGHTDEIWAEDYPDDWLRETGEHSVEERKGMIFDECLGEFRMDDEQYKKDVEENLPDNMKMAKTCLPAMKNVNKDLKFMTEAPEDFEKKRLPTLDFMI
jgi:hypothetical protein